jgi:hypothetical protein
MNYLKNFKEGNRFQNLEHSLAEHLKPVRPDPAFINSLRQKLSSGSATLLERRHEYFGLLALGLGLVFTAILVWLFKRLKKHQPGKNTHSSTRG